MFESATQRRADARDRSSGKGQKKRQIGPAEQLEWVKRYKASGAKNATIFAQQHPHDLKVRTFRDWCKWEATGELQRKVAQVAPGRDGGAGKRVRKSKWPELEEKLNQYIDLRNSKISRDKLGLNYGILREKVLTFARQLYGSAEVDQIKASEGWIARMLQRADKSGVVLQGEAQEISDAEAEAAIAQFKLDIKAVQDEHGIPVEHIFNGDQTGLYYRKLPNRTFCNKEERKTVRGVKQMKDKDRLTIMVCTSAVGKKCPLAVVGKAASPRWLMRRRHMCWMQCRS